MKMVLLLFLLVIPIALADITIKTDQGIYNLGNKVKVSASVMQDKNFEGFFKLTLSCGNYKLQNYFSNTVNLEANFRTSIPGLDFAELPVKSPMLGNCIIIGSLVTNDNLIIEEKESNSFSVTNQLTVLTVNSNITSIPGDTLLITGIVNEAFGNNVLKAVTNIKLDNASYSIGTIDGKFNLTLPISKSIKSGKHTIDISASEPKNNFGSSSIELEIVTVPSYIKVNLSGFTFEPGSKIGIIASLFDQADDLINAGLDLELTYPDGKKVFRKIVESGERIDYEFSQYAEPGSYTLISTYKNLLSQSSINITTVREVKIKYENETVLIENIGNVPFEDELTFILESESKKYPITKKIRVDPSQILNFDLSREVPSGIYDIAVPIKESLEPLKEKIKRSILATKVEIHDNRPVYKKIASGVSSISGALVGADGLLAKNPLITPIALVVIILLIIFRYGRKPIMRLIKAIVRLIKGKKNE